MNDLNTLLGTTTNLLNGLDPSWMSSDKGNDALFDISATSLKEQLETIPDKRGKWDFPDITLHDTAESLLNTLLPYCINNPSDTLETAEIPFGNLMIGDKDRPEALRMLSDTLGVDLNKTDSGFALVRLRRPDYEIYHSSIQERYLSYVPPTQAPKDLARAASRLKRSDIRQSSFTPDSITTKEAREFLDFFYAQGTHYVSEAVVGDEIFQVFQFPLKPFRQIKKIYETIPQKLSGPDAVLFIQFTTSYQDDYRGYVEKYGKLLSLSQNKLLSDPDELNKWKDDIYSKKESIFMPFRMDGGISLTNLNKEYTRQTAIKIHLTSITLFMEYSRRMIWERVFKGAIIQKYQTAIRPNFHVYYPKEKWQKLQRSSSGSTLSTLCTPVIDLFTPVTDLDNLRLYAPEIVVRLTLTTQLLTHSSENDIFLPGKDVLVNVQTIALENENVQKLIFEDEAFNKLEFYNQHFYGALIISNQSGDRYYTLSDGLRYEFQESMEKRFRIQIADRVNKPIENIGIKNLSRAIDGIQFLSSFAESMYGILDPLEPTSLLLKDSFRWVTQLIPGDCTKKEWLSMRLKSLDMLHAGGEESLGAFVPVLNAEKYEKEIGPILDYIDVINQSIDTYERQIEMQKLQERMVDIDKNLNQNIIASGQLLCEYIQANVEQQKDLAGWYDNIIKGKKIELDNYDKAIELLWTELNAKRSEFINLALNYEQAVNDKLLQETIKNAIRFTFTAVKDLFFFGVTIATPASSIPAVKDFNAVVQRIQKFINITTAIDNIINTGEDIKSLTDAQKEFDGLTDLVTSNLNWDELIIKFDEILSEVPAELDVPSLKAQLVSTFKLFILKGKAYSNAQASYNTLAKDIYQQQGMQQLIEDQNKRLQELTKTLNTAKIEDLNVSEIDLVGLTGRLCIIRTNMLAILSKTFVLHDQALQYTNLQPGTFIGDFSLESIMRARVEQTKKTNDSLTELQRFQSFTTTEMDVPVEIPVSELKNGGIYLFRIWNDFQDFQLFTDTKIKSVVARIDGIESTDSGRYALRLGYNGRPFFNKGLDGTFLPFHTMPRGRSYPYEVEGNRPLFNDHGESWSQGVTMVTPYSVWEISLPCASNAGLRFKSQTTVTVILTFTLQARIKDVLLTAVPLPSEAEVIRSMSGSSKLHNWDAVFNMLLTNINDVLTKQYEKLKKEKGYGGKIQVDSLVKTDTINGYTIDQYSAREFDLTYGYPSLRFLINSDQQANLTFTINGTIRSGTKWIGEVCEQNEKKLTQIATVFDIPLSNLTTEIINGNQKLVLSSLGDSQSINEEKFNAIIKLSTVAGLVNGNRNVISVVLDMAKGTFDAECFENILSDEEQLALNEAIKSYFVKNPVYFIINSLNISKITTLDDLKPNQFLFKVLRTRNDHEILQLFIHTANREVTESDRREMDISSIEEPIPLGHQASLIISNPLMYNNILPEAIESWKLKGADDIPKRCSEFIEATIEGEVDLSSMNHSKSQGEYGFITFQYKPKGGNNVKWELDGMRISSQDDGSVKLSYSQEKVFEIIETSTSHTLFTKPVSSERTISTNITLNINGHFPLTIKSSDESQYICFSFSDGTVTVNARTSGGGSCGCGDDLEAQINKQLVKIIPGQLEKGLSIKFSDFSVFALQNLLFPCDDYINLTKAYLPSDLILLGNFIEKQG